MTAAGENAFEFRVEGRGEGPALVFVHGWPDGPELWRAQVDALSDRFRCVLVTLPNFGPLPDRRGGYDFPELVDMLANTIARAQPDGAPVTLITHDWGAYIGYLFEQKHPGRVRSMVALDIGGHVRPSSLKEVLIMVGYQWTLIACWLVGGVWPSAGNAMTRAFAAALHVPAPQAGRACSRFNYPYYHFWRGTLLPWARSSLLGRYRPRCRILFIYGARKPLMFHTERWLQRVEASGGRHVRIDTGGHWFMQTHADEVNALIASWLAA